MLTRFPRFPRFPRFLRFILLVLLATQAPFAFAADEVVVIVHRDNPNAIDRAYVTRLYLGATSYWPDGSPAFVLDQPEDSAARLTFSATVVGRSVPAVRAIWSQNIFAGKGLPPKMVTPDSEMKRVVAANRHAIGYIMSSQVDGSVRVLDR